MSIDDREAAFRVKRRAKIHEGATPARHAVVALREGAARTIAAAARPERVLSEAERTEGRALLLALIRPELDRRVRATVDADRELRRLGPRTSRTRRLEEAEAAERVARTALALVHEISPAK